MGTPPAPKPTILNVKANGSVKIGLCSEHNHRSSLELWELTEEEPNVPAWTVSWEEPKWPCTSQGFTIIIVAVISVALKQRSFKNPRKHEWSFQNGFTFSLANGPSRDSC